MRRHWGWILILAGCALPALGWGSRGHELVAYLAYVHAESDVQARIDQLVALNPCYREWQEAVAAETEITTDMDKRAALFMLAATWPDKIKSRSYECPQKNPFSSKDGGTSMDGRFSANVPPADTAAASQNIGYDDDRRHQYWHFIDTPYTTDGSKVHPAATPNAVTELKLLSKALRENDNPMLNSYDLIWITHLAGDLHQPLHAAERFSKELPNGDAGGNFEKICASVDSCGSDELHAYWDDLPGASDALHVVIRQAKELDAQAAKPAKVSTNFPAWSKESFAMAKADAYAAPFDTGSKMVLKSSITSEYGAKAK
ncbi:MAG TPA: S1/P1 nuclease, partial [Acidobacteriaceae bacterium]|nr:S1/P1 nuclease [Acidobacteriaceae bacterium]